jgi:periplasmic protein TonB
VAPRYPQSAMDRRLSGAVCFEFTVGTDGTPRDIVVLGSTATVFEQPAPAALARWKYPPLADGAPVVDRRLRTQIVFQL